MIPQPNSVATPFKLLQVSYHLFSDGSRARHILGPGFKEKKICGRKSDFIFLLIVTEQITFIADSCYQMFYLLIHYNRVRVTRARVYKILQSSMGPFVH